MTNPRLELVIFDCDGTLVDSRRMISTAMQRACVACGFDAPSDAEVLQHVGLPLTVVVANTLPAANSDQVEDVAQSYRDAFRAIRESREIHEPLYPGTLELLDLLGEHGIRLAVATGKSRRGLHSTLDLHQIGERFVTLRTNDDARGKPDPDMVLQILGETGVAPENAIVVGDTSFDIEMSRNAGVVPVGVSWGNHPPERLTAAGAAVVLGHFNELAGWIADEFDRQT